MSDEESQNRDDVQYDEDGNPIPKEALPTPIENPPITEDMDIDHDEMNHKLVEMYYHKQKTYQNGQEVLQIIKNSVKRTAMNYNKSYYAFKSLNLNGVKLSTLYNWLEQYQDVRICDLSNNLLSNVSTVNYMKYLQQ